ncbi:MAG: L-seryl-tRNA(Sec) selenium transferase [Deltaproteobacteria bacterium]|nr:L-seryl-tRNA(Sec) selenium transferase [Deltaproteobacteria bacterium]
MYNLNEYLRKFPKIQLILQDSDVIKLIGKYSYNVVKNKLDEILSEEKEKIKINLQNNKIPEDNIFEIKHFLLLLQEYFDDFSFSLKRVINGTGVVIHTNLGRSILPKTAVENVSKVASSYSNLEFNLKEGKRGKRYSHIEILLNKILNCETALVVNNNAAAVFMALNTFTSGIKKEVIVSRGELVEIGGSFRIPDIMKASGAQLIEVGTTNKTKINDYESEINENTALLLKVHHSNFKMTGFVHEVNSKELVEIGVKYNIPVMEDLGSGSFIKLEKFGLPKEPTAQEVVNTGIDIVTFSGDKLLGGPQAGIIAGKKKYVDLIAKNPLNRAFRIDKMTLAALEAVLFEYLDIDNAIKNIPTIHLLSQNISEIKKRGFKLLNKIKKLEHICKTMYNFNINIVEDFSIVGGGAMPDYKLKTYCLSITNKIFETEKLSEIFRSLQIPIVGKIKEDKFLIDLRTVLDIDIDDIINNFKKVSQIVIEAAVKETN